ncbi:sporulation protein YpjB [Radiobacillus kanasensis]|uniref:sporulation protein YpjB n=1 Tax=Radiobacillus kanasensis TaxID=2844358 RepID=UPI001E2B67BB|nr:sporulation protein YpjB [Radiobacillus kanasensis]UFU01291.1 sporulation protein YpjB [Radiobacillus kanasensis]
MKQRIMAVISITVLCWSMGSYIFSDNAFADHHSDISETLYEYQRFVQDGRLENAESVLNRHKDDLEKWISDHAPEESQKELFEILNQNLLSISNDSISKVEKLKYAYTLLLAFDSVSNPNVAIWKDWETNLQATLASIIEQDSPVTDEQLQDVMYKWEIIAPSLKMTASDEVYDSLHKAYQKIGEASTDDEKNKWLQSTYREMKVLDVTTMGHNKQMSNFFIMLMIVGGVITCTLSYVAWKKYIGEKKKKHRLSN